jgi:hypothetical protein
LMFTGGHWPRRRANVMWEDLDLFKDVDYFARTTFFTLLFFNIRSCWCTRRKVCYTTTSFKLMLPANNRVMWCNQSMPRNFQTEAAHSAVSGQWRGDVLYSADPLSLKRLTNGVTSSLTRCTADAKP